MRFVFLVLALVLAVPASASAFCGFYVSGADASLYANATMVVMMRDGTRTVLSMQNSYEGPPGDFAMVIPVPVVLSEDNVNTLPREIFERVDALAAPRLVEYWEQDPCNPMIRQRAFGNAMPMVESAAMPEGEAEADDLGVTVEAEFAVGEYDIVILSAEDSGGLDTWLRREDYNIPPGAGDVLRPYVENGTKFFVAKVDSSRVTFTDGKAVLSPIRVHYDADQFSLPVRLGLLNSQGQQDLLVHILARNQRYQVANYENAFIPTNIRVVDAVRNEFGGFYESLFRRTVQTNPRSVVTEYSWDASSCDPCPTEPLNPAEITTLGADVVPGDPYGFVLTRLHYRYTSQDLGEDLVFQAVNPVVGGRGTPDAEGKMQEVGAEPGHINNFQGRYIITHPWEGEVACENPQRGMWGGPLEGGTGRDPVAMAAPGQLSGVDNAARTNLGMLVAEDIPAINVVQGQAVELPGEPAVVHQAQPSLRPVDRGTTSCATCSAASSTSMWSLAALVGGLFLVLNARRRR